MPSLSALTDLLEHLFRYGEIAPREIRRDWQVWLPLLVKANFLQPLATEEVVITPLLYTVQEQTAVERQRYICFKLPAYRRYLLAILAQGLVSAGQLTGEEYRRRVAVWVGHDLAHLAGELNQLLDHWEISQPRLIDRSSAAVAAEFAAWHQAHGSYAEWDRTLLGRSGAPEDLFTAVLHHAAVLAHTATPSISQDHVAALLPSFALSLNGAAGLTLPPPASWTRARRQIQSSLPFYDAADRPLFDETLSPLAIWQDILARQPYYRAILRLFIAARFSGYSEAFSLRFADEWETARLYWGDRADVFLAALWPGLIQAMGYWPGTAVTTADLQRVLDHWRRVEVVTAASDAQLMLTESYARTLHERRRAQLLLRGQSRLEQERVDAFLKEFA
jgi:hypothetical protein